MPPTRPALALALVCAAAVLSINVRPAIAQEPSAAQFGVEQRVRNEDWNNLFDFNGGANDEREQIRYRTRLWTSLPLPLGIEFNAGLNSETNQKLGQNNVFDEVAFETLNVNIRKLFVKGLSLKVGRQDLIRGEGLVLIEGTPGDGSRTMYFNAADLAYSFRKSKLEAIAILDPKQDRLLPMYNDQHKYLMDWDDQALGLYYTDKNLKNTTIETYFFHKKEIRDRLARTSPQYQPDRRIETLGGRVVQRLNPRWSVAGEFARQWGNQHPTTPISAWGGYGYVKRQSEARRKPYVQLGFWALSGDDPAHPERVGGWDPLFSRWPKWGDLELYAQVPEKGVGYATNQTRWQMEGGFAPAPKLALRFTCFKLGAFHPFAGSPTIFGDGTDRGTHFQTRLDFTVNGHFRGHVEYTELLPSDFYAHRDPAYFLRFEIIAEARTSVRDFWHRVARQ